MELSNAIMWLFRPRNAGMSRYSAPAPSKTGPYSSRQYCCRLWVPMPAVKSCHTFTGKQVTMIDQRWNKPVDPETVILLQPLAIPAVPGAVPPKFQTPDLSDNRRALRKDPNRNAQDGMD